ncbi:MAG TPA: DUF1641 domain-containing protein [Ignavibacteria bacterium]|jgi:uncharacterized protein YjgD (DUF1641 family)
MENKEIESQIKELSSKLDIILEEIELQKKHRREIEDLKDDLTRVGKGVYDTAVVELEELHDSFQPRDLIYLSKRLLRNVNTIDKSIQQMESLKDFLQDATPLARDYFFDFMNKLDEFDRKGYFQFLKESTKIIDHIVTSFTPEDVKNLSENIVTILQTVKNLTQPDMLQTVNSALNIYKKLDIEITDEVSIFKLLKEMNTPEMKRGAAFLIRFLKSLSESQNKLILSKN